MTTVAMEHERKDGVMAYHLEKRNYRRIPVAIDGELITCGATYAALIENISEHSILARIAHHQALEQLTVSVRYCLRLHLPSGRIIHINCRKIWTDRNTPHSLIEHIAVELIDPPREYQELLRELSHKPY